MPTHWLFWDFIKNYFGRLDTFTGKLTIRAYARTRARVIGLFCADYPTVHVKFLQHPKKAYI